MAVRPSGQSWRSFHLTFLMCCEESFRQFYLVAFHELRSRADRRSRPLEELHRETKPPRLYAFENERQVSHPCSNPAWVREPARRNQRSRSLTVGIALRSHLSVFLQQSWRSVCLH